MIFERTLYPIPSSQSKSDLYVKPLHHRHLLRHHGDRDGLLPFNFYKADEVHLFRYIRDLGTASAKLYEDHYREACNQILRSLPSCRIVDGRRCPWRARSSGTSSTGSMSRSTTRPAYPRAPWTSRLGEHPVRAVLHRRPPGRAVQRIPQGRRPEAVLHRRPEGMLSRDQGRRAEGRL